MHTFANSHDMLFLKFDLLNGLTGTLYMGLAWDTMLQDAMYMYFVPSNVLLCSLYLLWNQQQSQSETCNSNSSLHLCIREDN